MKSFAVPCTNVQTKMISCFRASFCTFFRCCARFFCRFFRSSSSGGGVEGTRVPEEGPRGGQGEGAREESSTPLWGRSLCLRARSGKQLGMWCYRLPFSLLSPTHGIFAARDVYPREGLVWVWWAWRGRGAPAELQWRQPALLRAGEQATRCGGRGWPEMRTLPGMRWALLGSQARGATSPPAHAWHLSDRSGLRGVTAMVSSSSPPWESFSDGHVVTPVVSAAIWTQHSVKGISTFMRLSCLPTGEPRPGRWDGDGPSGHQVPSPDGQQHEQSSEDFWVK